MLSDASVSENVGDGAGWRLMAYVAEATALLTYPLATAIALMVTELETVSGMPL